MLRKMQFALVLTGALLAAAVPVLAQDNADNQTPQPQAMSSMHNGPMHDMGPMGTMNMMRMMSQCPMMGGKMAGMGNGMMGMPALPPGNEKLQLQMQAEMMQRAGEILAKYAARVQEPKK